jgi:hypothetical protein
MQLTPVITVETRNHFSPLMELLRRDYSELSWPGKTSEDEFDARSVHITVSVDGELAGMVRLTRRPLSVLSTWTIGAPNFPEGSDTLEATRGVVARKWRGMDLYKLMMAEVTFYADRVGASRIIAAIEPDFPLRPFLRSIGYQDWGALTRLCVPPLGELWGQVILQEPARALERVSGTLAECLTRLQGRGFSVRPLSFEAEVEA